MRIRSTLIVALLAVGGAAVAMLWRQPDGRPVSLVRAEEGPISSNIIVTGKVSGERLVEIAAQQAGKISAVNVVVGERVRRGAVLARLDNSLAQAALVKAEALAKGAAAEVSEVERRLERLRLVGSAESEQARDGVEAELDRALARLEQAEADVELARIQAEQHILYAPFDGVIIERDAEVGKVVAPGWTGAQRAKHLFTLLDDSQRLIESNVDAGDSATIAVGDIVSVTSEAHPDYEWQESVIYVGPVIDRQVEAETANTFRVDVSLGDQAPPLLFGQQVDLTIRAAHADSALQLPFAAIAIRSGRPHVARVVDGRIDFQPIETGIESLTDVQVVDGLEPGAEVVLLEGRLLQQGDRVVPPPGSLAARQLAQQRDGVLDRAGMLLTRTGLLEPLDRWGVDSTLERAMLLATAPILVFGGAALWWRRRAGNERKAGVAAAGEAAAPRAAGSSPALKSISSERKIKAS